MNVNGGDIDNASAADYVMHFLTFGFKVWKLGLYFSYILQNIYVFPKKWLYCFQGQDLITIVSYSNLLKINRRTLW